MELAAINNWDQSDSWSLIKYHRQAPVQTRPRSNVIILLLAVSAHAGFIGYLFSWQAPDALVLEIEPRSAAGKNQNKQLLSGRLFARPNTQTTTAANSAEEIQDTTLRLTLDKDEWNAAPVVAPKNPLQRQFIAVPGRIEPFVDGLKFRKQLSPQQRLAMVAKLFGAVEYDVCKEARKRMASGQSQMHDLDVEADLRSIERHCRP